jgi:hypothetical protein
VQRRNRKGGCYSLANAFYLWDTIGFFCFCQHFVVSLRIRGLCISVFLFISRVVSMLNLQLHLSGTKTYLLHFDYQALCMNQPQRLNLDSYFACGHFYPLTFYCSGLNQSHTECSLVVLNKSTLKQKYTPHTHGYALKKKKTSVPCQI